jgi:hypothetical protein
MSGTGGRPARSRHSRQPANGPGLVLTAIVSVIVVGAFAGWTALPPSARSAVEARAAGDLRPIGPKPGQPPGAPDNTEPTRAAARVVPELPTRPAAKPPKPAPRPQPNPSPLVGKLKPVASPVSATSAGRFRVAPGPAAAAAATKLVRYTVEIEHGLALIPVQIATVVDTTLADKRGWTADGYTFRRVGSGGDLRILLATPGTVDKLCAPLDTQGQVSCRNQNLVVLNEHRWMLGAPAYGASIAAYRQYLINHEVGHFLGHGHVGCPGRGRYAPVMLQQTLRLDGCRPNPWPALSLPASGS